MALGYGNFLVGVEEFKALPLKERRRHLKNEVFRVSSVMTLSGVICVGSSYSWPSFQDAVLISELLDDHRDALKAKEGEVADMLQEMEELSIARRRGLRRSVSSKRICTTR